MSAEVTKSLMYPEQGTPEYFTKHKFVVGKAIEKAIIDGEYELDCTFIGSGIYIREKSDD